MEHTDQEKRLYLHKLLKAIPEVMEVYHQPPETIKMEYPCIRYKWDRNKTNHADDKVYLSRRGYLVTIIDSNPDSVIPGIFEKNFSLVQFDRSYVSNNLYHWVYTLYF